MRQRPPRHVCTVWHRSGVPQLHRAETGPELLQMSGFSSNVNCGARLTSGPISVLVAALGNAPNLGPVELWMSLFNFLLWPTSQYVIPAIPMSEDNVPTSIY